MIEIVEVGDPTGEDEHLALLATVEGLHRQLRPGIPSPYRSYLREMFSEGARLSVVLDDERPLALALWRVHLTTFAGRRFYVDDLVTDERERSRGWGGKLLGALEDRARALGCDSFSLDSGVQRAAAHRFYFRSGLVIRSFGFGKTLNGGC